MVKLNTFSRLKNIFSKLNPLNSFNWDDKDDLSISISSEELLEKVINEYPNFKKVVMICIYHLINVNNKNNEYLTILTKNNKLIVDLLQGSGDNVKIPFSAKIEGKRKNILVACHNHFFGAIIPSLDDLTTFLNNNCQFAGIVSCNNIGILINESDEINHKHFVNDFKLFREYIGFCIENEKFQEFDEIDMMDISEEKREKMKSVIHDKFLAENIEKFINEFNIRFNKYKIYELYIKI